VRNKTIGEILAYITSVYQRRPTSFCYYEGMTARQLNLIAWCVSVAASALAIIAWGDGLSWQLSTLGTYSLFPLLGLLAFGLMWAHYVMSAIRQYANLELQTLRTWFDTTSWIVLAAIALHPGLLVWQLWRDGYGLPPISYLQNYVAPSLRVFALLGTVSWFVFLAYELRRRYSKKSWWQFVSYGTDVAMLAVFLHGLQLGSQLQGGWFRWVWLFYGATLVVSLWYIYTRRFNAKPGAKT
jgi:hypothetical protein